MRAERTTFLSDVALEESKNNKNSKGEPVKWPPSASVGIGGCVSPQQLSL
jgi:hypothetical protein